MILERNRDNFTIEKFNELSVCEIIRLDHRHFRSRRDRRTERQEERALRSRCDDQLGVTRNRLAGERAEAIGQPLSDPRRTAILGVGLPAAPFKARLAGLE